jgi:phosphatidylserine/phosphatidylglycerophosphate/cardiolipin synthase-like enzyme
MSIQVHFNKPVRAFGAEQIAREIKGATKKVAIASAWFTDIDIAQALIDSPAPFKMAILNGADIQRGSKQAYELLKKYFEPTGGRFIKPGEIPHGLFVLGSSDWQEGVMHHKFVLIDDSVVWAGSYNLTFQARKNYETMLRIDDKNVSEQFWTEAKALAAEVPLFWKTLQFATSDTAFRCAKCEKLWPKSAIGQDGGSWIICKQCATIR